MLVSDYQENYINGWVKLFRSFSKWEWYKDSKMVHMFIHLLVNANHKDQNWQGHKIMRGQLITGRKQLSSDTGISEQSVRTCLDRLKSTNEITIKTTNKNSLITILNYDLYQGNKNTNQEHNQQLTNNQPTTNQQLTTNNKDNNINNDNNEKNTHPALISFRFHVKEYSKELNIPDDIVENFLDHWTQFDYESKKFGWQVPDTFLIKSRLKGWIKREDKNSEDWKEKLKTENL